MHLGIVAVACVVHEAQLGAQVVEVAGSIAAVDEHAQRTRTIDVGLRTAARGVLSPDGHRGAHCEPHGDAEGVRFHGELGLPGTAGARPSVPGVRLSTPAVRRRTSHSSAMPVTLAASSAVATRATIGASGTPMIVPA